MNEWRKESPDCVGIWLMTARTSFGNPRYIINAIEILKIGDGLFWRLLEDEWRKPFPLDHPTIAGSKFLGPLPNPFPKLTPVIP